MSRPVVALSAYVECSRWGAWDAVCDQLPRLPSAVQRAGALALLLPPTRRW